MTKPRAKPKATPKPKAKPRPKRWVVYLVRCRDGSLYTGITNDLTRRLDAHNAGTGARYTRARRPVELAYQEPAKSKGAALRREYAIKRLRVAVKRALAAGR